MRPIKFRAWYEVGKEMFNVDVLAISPVTWDSGGTGVSLAYQPHIEVMQFTGLKDKNGKEIYEGDVVKITDEFEEITVGKVEWGLTSGNYGTYPAFCIYEFESEMNSFADIYDSGIYEIEVIGNIYEDPELLEGEINV